MIFSLVIRYIKFDTVIHAAECELLVTRVISRMDLQEILAHAVGEDVFISTSNVVDFVDHGIKVIIETIKLKILRTFYCRFYFED